ncbi:hypothetical protein C0J52_14784 [Blattella germanica]|nr:hypothetical protein C0J52_14784 [Blattella germanica]
MKLVLCFLLLALFVNKGESIKCYVCSSSETPDCADHVSKLEPKECSTSGLGEVYDGIRKGLQGLTMFLGTEVKQLNTPFACQKTVISDYTHGNSTIVRTCSLAKAEGVDPCALTVDVEKLVRKNVKTDFCEVCETDLCNGSSRHSFSISFFITMVCFAVLLPSWYKFGERGLNHIKSTITYGSETWHLKSGTIHKLHSTEIDFWRRSARISWRDKIRNSLIREKIKVKGSLTENIKTAQLRWFGYPMGRRKSGRPNITWTEGILKTMRETGRIERNGIWL